MQAIDEYRNLWLPDSVRRNWGWMLALGILLVLLGTCGLMMASAITIASVLVFGALLVVGGIAQLIAAFQAKGWKSITLQILIALLYVVAGGLAVYDPLAASLSLTLFIAAMLLVAGTMRAIMAFQMRPVTGWGWVLAGALASILLGMLILAQWPVSGLLAIGLFIAIELVIDGWSCIWFALAARPRKSAHDT